ncbi:hypothetical protein [Halorubellus litoreus]|uniref:Uncharacterized protein n=1 Tax=Halorubellus litoreus TaxID=755308 RepID=A0ABD5VAN2_9EURY
MTDDATAAARVESLADPEALHEREDVPYEEDERDLPAEKFEALRERYEQLAGVTQFGITNDDGGVLLAGDESYAPLGGNVRPDDDWVAATERAASALFAVDVRVDHPTMVERTVFRHEDDPDRAFVADSVLFEASVVPTDDGRVDSFLATPSFVDDLDHPMYGGDETTLAWFDAVTDDVHENHRGHVERFLD